MCKFIHESNTAVIHSSMVGCRRAFSSKCSIQWMHLSWASLRPGACSQLHLAPPNVPWLHEVTVYVSFIAGLPFPGAQTLRNALHCWLHTSVLPCNQTSKAPKEGSAPKTVLRSHQTKLSCWQLGYGGEIYLLLLLGLYQPSMSISCRADSILLTCVTATI